MAILALLVTFLLVIGLHEAGHALAAAWCGVKIKRISLGLGKPLITWPDCHGGCEYVWGRWPLGGYVQLLNSRIEKVDPRDFHQSFDKQPAKIRYFILLSGALANLITAFFALILYFALGYQQHLPVIESIIPNSPAAIAGLHANDRITAVGGEKTNSWQAVGMKIIINLGKSSVPITVNSDLNYTRLLTLNLSQILSAKNRFLLQALGIKPSTDKKTLVTYKGLSAVEAFKNSLLMIIDLLTFYLLMLKQLFLGLIPFSLLLGPFGLIAVSITSFSQGLAVFLYFIASFSLAVGMVNLLPIPSLDGGSLMYVFIEQIRGKKVSVELEVLLHRLAVILFSIFFVQLILNDLVRMVS